MKEKIFVFGASGHAKVVIDIIERQGLYEIVFLADDDPGLKGTVVYGYQVIGGKDDLLTNAIERGIVAIGSNQSRRSVSLWLTDNGFELASAVHPTAQLARGVTIGAGSVIMAGAVINADSRIGDNVIVNTRSSIDHDCVVGNFTHIAPGATLCGTVQIGEGSFICAGATVIPNLTIGSFVTVGAGAVVVHNILDGVTVAGIPARKLK
ncbi:acetyltransferase [Trichlorobacter lovleyi]|uniref:acetyltransferase n=1 Tax=Trichlorobacter lovleyi TaxID=313985 RepID=UPI003D0AA669